MFHSLGSREQANCKVTFLLYLQDSNHNATTPQRHNAKIRCVRRVVVVHFSILG